MQKRVSELKRIQLEMITSILGNPVAYSHVKAEAIAERVTTTEALVQVSENIVKRMMESTTETIDASDTLTPEQFAAYIGRSTRFLSDHEDEIPSFRVGSVVWYSKRAWHEHVAIKCGASIKKSPARRSSRELVASHPDVTF